jgi:hypothetical protein
MDRMPSIIRDGLDSNLRLETIKSFLFEKGPAADATDAPQP